MNTKVSLPTATTSTTTAEAFGGYLPSGIVAVTGPTAGTMPLTGYPYTVHSKPSPEIEKAVYAYIQAIRALGQLTANTADIARALSIPMDQVEVAVLALKSKGVNVAA